MLIMPWARYYRRLKKAPWLEEAYQCPTLVRIVKRLGGVCFFYYKEIAGLKHTALFTGRG